MVIKKGEGVRTDGPTAAKVEVTAPVTAEVTPSAKTEDKATVLTQTKRFAWWWVISLAALIGVLWLAPQQGEVMLYKLAQVSVGLLLAYLADRALFDNGPYVDASMPRDVLSAGRLIARAIVALAILVGLTIGI